MFVSHRSDEAAKCSTVWPWLSGSFTSICLIFSKNDSSSRTIYCVILPEVRRKGGNTEISRRLSVYRLPAIPQSVCRAVWIALLGTSDKSVKRNCHLPLCSFPEAHRNTGRAPVHALSQRKINCVCDFILEIAEADGLPNPRFTFSEPGEDGIQTVVDVKNIVHLPPHYTLQNLFSRYESHYDNSVYSEEDLVGFTSFRKIYHENQRLRHIKLSTRTRGVCEKCKAWRESLMKTSDPQRTEEILIEFQEHLKAAERQQKLYKERANTAVKSWNRHGRLQMAVISFDYGVAWKCPRTAQQTQGEYMAERFGLDIFLFGIVNEGAHEYNAYLYPEGFNSGNCEMVISLVLKFLNANPRVDNCRKLFVYSDSCSGQNRNNFVLAFWIHRILNGKHDKIVWSFLVVGHTKFTPDQLFGLMRHIAAKFNLMTPIEVAVKASLIGEMKKDWKAKGVYCEDGFYHFKNLSEPFKAFVGIKKLDIAEIVFKKHIAESGETQCKVYYRLNGPKERLSEIFLLKHARSRESAWPSDWLLPSNYPAQIQRRPLSSKRYLDIVKNIHNVVGMSDSDKQFYIDLPHKNVSTANDDVNLAPNPRAPPPPPPTIDPPAQPAQEEPAPCLAEEETTSSEAPGLMGGIAGSFMCDGHDDLVRHENFGFAAEDGPSTPPQSPSASDHEALTGTTARRQLLTHITPSPKRTRDKWLESALSISSRDKRRRRASPFDKFWILM